MTDDGGWDDFADGWDDDPAAIAYAKAAFSSLELVLADRERTLDRAGVLDFGCGTGLLAEQLVDRVAAIDAMDTSPAMLAVLRGKAERHGSARPWANVRVLEALPTSGSYDLIVASSVCSFLDDYRGVVAHLASLLAAGGTFVQWDWEQDPTDDDSHGLTREAVAEALTSAGLEMVTVDTAFEVRVGDAVMAPIVGAGSKPPS